MRCEGPGRAPAEQCSQPVKYRGLCSGHAEQRRVGNQLTSLRAKRRDHTAATCRFDGCVKAAESLGLCYGHYEQQRRGQALRPLKPRRPTNSSARRDEHGRKLCPTCTQWLSLDRFSRVAGHADNHHYECRDCTRWRRMLRAMNVSAEQYEQLLTGQNGVCAICREPNADGSPLVVDHDHKCCVKRGTSCGRCVRGLLCHRCNTGIGSLRDDPTVMRAAIRYVELGPRRVGMERVH